METLEQKYEHEKVGKLLMMFSVPSVISLVLNALYNMVDQIFIGNGVGYLGNGATNVIFPLTQLAIAIGLLIGDGTASYMNLKLGEGKREDAEKGMAAGLVALMISGVTLSILLTVFLQPLCRLFGATDDIMPYPLYTRTVILSLDKPIADCFLFRPRKRLEKCRKRSHINVSNASVIWTSRVSQTPLQTPIPYFHQWVPHGKKALVAIACKTAHIRFCG